MGYRGKVELQEQARDLRLTGMTVPDIAASLGVAKSSVALWVRDLGIEVRRRAVVSPRPNPLRAARLAEIELLDREGRERIASLSEREFLVAGTALYAAEGGKTDGSVSFPNSDPAMIRFFLTWLRHFFDVDETRLRLRPYLHEGVDLEEAVAFWTTLTNIPPAQHGKPYRAVPDPSIRRSKHPLGCPRVDYSCSRTHRAIMGLVRALVSCDLASFRGGEIGITADC